MPFAAQRMEGHHNGSTTERYILHLRTDLADAARRLAAGNVLQRP